MAACGAILFKPKSVGYNTFEQEQKNRSKALSLSTDDWHSSRINDKEV